MVVVTVTCSTEAEANRISEILRREGLKRKGRPQSREFYYKCKFSGTLVHNEMTADLQTVDADNND